MQLAVIMDPIGEIQPAKDTTLALLLAAASRGWRLHYAETADLYLQDGEPGARLSALEVHDDSVRWYQLKAARDRSLAEMDAILMRVDPPVTMDYMYPCYLLEYAEARGVPVYNSPSGLRAINEKLHTQRYAELTPPTLVSRDPRRLLRFLEQQRTIVIKPLNRMGGQGVRKLQAAAADALPALEAATEGGRTFILAQEFLARVTRGDRRVLVIDGQPWPQVLVRTPAPGELRANLAAGGSYRGASLSDAERRICERLRPDLERHGILFAGLDLIDGRLTEINVTSPTCVRELERLYGPGICDHLLDCIEQRRGQKPATAT